MGQITAEIVAHSLSPQGDELISVLCTFPRIILAEVNTHRMLSKNTSSSRAIPFKKMVESVQSDPFIPIAYQKKHSGMQGSEYHENRRHLDYHWLKAKDNAIEQASFFHDNCEGTKQLANRLLEPFMWTTMLITGPRSGWDNFFNLRCPVYEDKITGKTVKSRKEISPLNEYGEYPKYFSDTLEWLKINKGQAEIHIMDLAEKIYDALNESTSEQLKAGEWHIPFEDAIKRFIYIADPLDAVKVSTAMAARTSYTVVGEEKEIDYEKMIGLHDRLLTQDPPHSSPMEHCARVMSNEEYYLFNKGKAYTSEWDKSPNELHFTNSEKGWCRNFKGFIPYRHIIETKKYGNI